MAQTDVIPSDLSLVDWKSNLKEIDVLFLFGVGDGSAYRSLKSWLGKEEGRFLVFIEEREELFLKAKELPLAKDQRVRLFYWKRGDEEIFQHASWEFVFLRFGYASLNPEMNRSALDFFTQLEHYHRGIDLLASDSEDMGLKVLKNAIKNLSALPRARFGAAMEGKCASVPAIVCGAGPSLDIAMPLLEKVKGKALIIAGGSSVRALSARGVFPDLCSHLDPHPPYRRFLEQDTFDKPFFYQGRLCHALLEKVHGPLVYMPDSGSYPLEGWLAAEAGIFAERFDAGWTVANFSAAIAAHLGCSPIIFVGMDFSCGPNAIYASEIPGEENRNELVELEKGKLYSKRDWLMSAEWMSAFAKKHPSIQWINATAGGIELPGIERKDLAEVLGTLATEFDIEAIVHQLIFEAPLSQVTDEKVESIRKKLNESFKKGLEICEKMLKVWEKYYPQSPLEKGEYALLDTELEQEICFRHFLIPLWNVWRRPILRTSFHPLGQHVHRLLFFKRALETHLSHLRA